MYLKCPNCGVEIPARQINIRELIAVCPTCNYLFNLSENDITHKVKRDKFKMPAGIQVQHEDEDQLNLSYRLVFGPGSKFWLMCSSFAALFWTVLFLYEQTIFLGLVSLVLWYVLSIFVTTTIHITANEAGIKVRTGPWPFPIKDDKILRKTDILYVASKKSKSPFPLNRTYNVYVEMHDGECIDVVSSLPQAPARYLAATLDDYLSMEADEIAVINNALDEDMLLTKFGHMSDDEFDTAFFS